MTDYTEIVLQEDTRWDIVSYRAYGTIDRIPEIAEANPTIPLRDMIEAGTKLYLPILEEAEIQTDQLPPWKR